MMSALAQRLQVYRQQGLYRQRNRVDQPGLVAFDSNDYLGLKDHPALVEALAAGAERYGAGGGGSHLICGHHAEHQALEEELAEFVGRDRVLLFSSGYMANLGVMQTLLGRHDTVVGDR
ncbi:MAG: 8-amino-7-oxononanoate synthase, partial [Gammaproteobacteria bacterium]